MDAQDLRAALLTRGLDLSVVDLVCSVPRDRFLPPSLRGQAWLDLALPLSDGQTISQPTVVAVMTQAADVGPGDHVLDVGTGSGYQAAVLATAGAEVHSIERIPALAQRARVTLAALGVPVEVRCADGAPGAPRSGRRTPVVARPEVLAVCGCGSGRWVRGSPS